MRVAAIGIALLLAACRSAPDAVDAPAIADRLAAEPLGLVGDVTLAQMMRRAERVSGARVVFAAGDADPAGIVFYVPSGALSIARSLEFYLGTLDPPLRWIVDAGVITIRP